jgi:hypothetical protein
MTLLTMFVKAGAHAIAEHVELFIRQFFDERQLVGDTFVFARMDAPRRSHLSKFAIILPTAISQTVHSALTEVKA